MRKDCVSELAKSRKEKSPAGPARQRSRKAAGALQIAMAQMYALRTFSLLPAQLSAGTLAKGATDFATTLVQKCRPKSTIRRFERLCQQRNIKEVALSVRDVPFVIRRKP